MKIAEIRDNSGAKRKVFKNLQIGTKLRAIKDIISTDDVGMSGQTFRYPAFIKNNTYKVKHNTEWDFIKISYVADESGALHFATPDVFEII
jgi:hypothetical protein